MIPKSTINNQPLDMNTKSRSEYIHFPKISKKMLTISIANGVGYGAGRFITGSTKQEAINAGISFAGGVFSGIYMINRILANTMNDDNQKQEQTKNERV
jgi:hypothetical protein